MREMESHVYLMTVLGDKQGIVVSSSDLMKSNSMISERQRLHPCLFALCLQEGPGRKTLTASSCLPEFRFFFF